MRLSPEEVLGLRKAVNMVNRGAALYGDTDPHFLALLDVLEDKLDVDLALCRHCHGAPRRSRDGLCARCAQYRRDDAGRRGVPTLDGGLPDDDVLRRRIQRAARREPMLRLVG